MRTDVDISLARLTRESALSRGEGKRQKSDPAQEKLRLQRAAREFESLLLEHMVKEMRTAMPKSELQGREPGQELFQEMLDGEFVRLMTESGGIGIADFLLRSLADKGITR